MKHVIPHNYYKDKERTFLDLFLEPHGVCFCMFIIKLVRGLD